MSNRRASSSVLLCLSLLAVLSANGVAAESIAGVPSGAERPGKYVTSTRLERSGVDGRYNLVHRSQYNDGDSDHHTTEHTLPNGIKVYGDHSSSWSTHRSSTASSDACQRYLAGGWTVAQLQQYHPELNCGQPSANGGFSSSSSSSSSSYSASRRSTYRYRTYYTTAPQYYTTTTPGNYVPQQQQQPGGSQPANYNVNWDNTKDDKDENQRNEWLKAQGGYPGAHYNPYLPQRAPTGTQFQGEAERKDGEHAGAQYNNHYDPAQTTNYQAPQRPQYGWDVQRDQSKDVHDEQQHNSQYYGGHGNDHLHQAGPGGAPGAAPVRPQYGNHNYPQPQLPGARPPTQAVPHYTVDLSKNIFFNGELERGRVQQHNQQNQRDNTAPTAQVVPPGGSGSGSGGWRFATTSTDGNAGVKSTTWTYRGTVPPTLVTSFCPYAQANGALVPELLRAFPGLGSAPCAGSRATTVPAAVPLRAYRLQKRDAASASAAEEDAAPVAPAADEKKIVEVICGIMRSKHDPERAEIAKAFVHLTC